jgi:hypothetical protein
MIFYFFITVILFFILYLASSCERKYQNVYYFIFFSVLFLLAGLRGDVGQDTFSYQQHYINLIDFDSFLKILTSREPLLYIVMYPHKLLFDDYTGFLLCISLLQISLLFYATKNMYHRSTFLAIYILVIFIEYHFNLLRASLALLFFLCSMRAVVTNKRQSIIFFCLALLSHLSALIFLPVLLISLKLKVRGFVFIIVFFALLGGLGAIFFGDIIASKVLVYGLLNTSNFKIPLIVSALLVFSWITLLSNKIIDIKSFMVLFIFSVAFFMSSLSDIAYRIYYMMFTVLIYFTFENKAFDIKKVRVQPYVLSVFLLSLWFTYSMSSHVAQERDKRLITGKRQAEFAFAPYSFYYDSKYR